MGGEKRRVEARCEVVPKCEGPGAPSLNRGCLEEAGEGEEAEDDLEEDDGGCSG